MTDISGDLHPSARWLKPTLERDTPSADWLDKVDPACWDVLAALGGIHNITNPSLPGCGVSPLHQGGVELMWRSAMSTQDADEMTRLVIAAHQHSCRVSVDAVMLWGRTSNPLDWEAEIIETTEDYDTAMSVPDTSGDLTGGCCVTTVTSVHCPERRCDAPIHRDDPASPWKHGYAGEAEDHEHLNSEHAPSPAESEWLPMAPFQSIKVHPRPAWGSTDTDSRNMTEHPTLDMLARRVEKAVASSVESGEAAERPTDHTTMNVLFARRLRSEAAEALGWCDHEGVPSGPGCCSNGDLAGLLSGAAGLLEGTQR